MSKRAVRRLPRDAEGEGCRWIIAGESLEPGVEDTARSIQLHVASCSWCSDTARSLRKAHALNTLQPVARNSVFSNLC